LIHYLDTSLLVAAYTAERNSERLVVWLKGLAGIEIAISQWTRVEFSSALAIKVRTRQITPALQMEAAARFLSSATGSFTEFPVVSEDFATAANWCADHRSALRAGDALHLAVARRNEATLCTLDKRLHVAGRRFSVRTALI
jgi:hypothetical protein